MIVVDGKGIGHMLVFLGAVVGFLAFLPVFVTLRLTRRSAASPLTLGLYGLGGVAISLVILVAGLIACAMLAREQIVAFAVAEAVLFLGCTIAWVVYRNAATSRGRKTDKQ